MKTPLKVLLVEDESIIAMHIQTILTELGYEVTGVLPSGEDAIVSVRQTRPDILLLDIRLRGEMDGIETARHINLEYDIPVVYITAHSDHETVERAKLTEPCGYILKPVNENRIYTEIELAYNKHVYMKKLRESNDRYEMLFNSSNDSVSLIRLERNGRPGRFIEVNDVTCRTLMYSREELLSMNYMDIIPRNEQDYVLGMFKKLSNRRRTLFEVTHLARDLSGIPCEVNTHLFSLDDELIVIANARDITDRRLAETALRESEKRYRLLFQMMHSGFCLFELVNSGTRFVDLKILEMNNAMVQMLGKTRKIIGKRIRDISPGLASELFEYFENMAGTGKAEEFTAWSETLGRWLFVTPYFIGNDRLACIVNDITDTVRSEQEMRLKDSAIESSISGVVIADLDGLVSYVNRSFLDMWGFTHRQEVEGKIFTELFDTGSGEIFTLKPIIDRGQLIGEITLRRESGFSLELKYAASLIRDREERPLYIMSSFIDITEQKRLEKEIMRISEIERQSIGQDLHDGLGQKLTGIAFLVEALRSTMETNGYPELSEIEEIKKHVDESIEQTRKIARGLCPVKLESFGLESAIDELAAEITGVFKIPCRIEKKGFITVRDNSTATNLYYIIRESVNNAIRHGKPTEILIRLIENRRRLTATVENDGIVVKKKTQDKGMGLMIMRYRAHLMRGEFEAFPLEKGFIVRVVIPDIY